MRAFYAYLLTNYTNSVIYTGATNDLVRRVYEHREKLANGFTERYNVWKLVYYEVADDAVTAMAREQIKGGSRQKKVALIEASNPQWRTYTRT